MLRVDPELIISCSCKASQKSWGLATVVGGLLLSEHLLVTYSLVRTVLGIEANRKIKIQGGRDCFAVIHRGTARYQLRGWGRGGGGERKGYWEGSQR